MILYALAMFLVIGVAMIALPESLGMPRNWSMMLDLMGSLIMMIPYAGVMYKLVQTTAIHIVDDQKPGMVTGMVSYPDGSTRFYPVLRRAQKFLHSIFGIGRDRLDKPLRLPGGATVYPMLTSLLATNNWQESELASRFNERYGLNTPNELYLFLNLAYEFRKENDQIPDQETLEDIARRIDKRNLNTEEERKILDMNRRELKKHWKKHPIDKGVVFERVGDVVVDAFALQQYVLDQGMEQDFDTLRKRERLDERLGKAELEGARLSPDWKKYILLAVLIGVGILMVVLFMYSDQIIGFLKGIGGA